MTRFIFPTELLVGKGCVAELKKYLSKEDKVFIITDTSLVMLGIVDKVTTILDELGIRYKIYDEVPINPHGEDVEKCRAALEAFKGNKVICVGGGSPMDTAKAVAMLGNNEGAWSDYQWDGKQPANPPLDYFAIPTTAGTGSEATKTTVIIDRNSKKGVGGDAYFAKVALIDPELMVSLPPHLTATTGVDALTHAIEGYIGRNAQPITDALALEAIRLLGLYLVKAFKDGADLEAREKVGIAAAMAGLAMDQSGLGVVHAMSGPLSSYYNVPHGLSNAVLLPWGLYYNQEVSGKKILEIGKALGLDTQDSGEVIDTVKDMMAALEIPLKLDGYLEKEEDIPLFAEEACNMFLMKNNPKDPNKKEIEAIFAAIL